MSIKADRLYWDTSVFLCFLSEEEAERRKVCEHILRRARAGRVEILTSMFTLVEVIRPKAIKHPIPLTEDQVAKLEGMFKWPFIKKIQVHEELATAASRLARSCGLKPADAIHAATAIHEKADQLQVWDYDFAKVAHLITVANPDFLDQEDIPLLSAENIGPSPDDFKPSLQPSSVSPLPSEQSTVDELAKEPQPEPDRRAIRLIAPASPPPDSSPTVTKPPQSER